MSWFWYSMIAGSYAMIIICLFKLITIEHKVDNLLDVIQFSRRSVTDAVRKQTVDIIEYQSYTKDCFKALASYCSWVESKRKKHKKK